MAGRPPIFERPMSGAERVRRFRIRQKLKNNAEVLHRAEKAARAAYRRAHAEVLAEALSEAAQ